METIQEETTRHKPRSVERNVFPNSGCWTRFVRGCPNQATRKNYMDAVLRYMEFLKIDEPDKLLQGTNEQKEDNILAYIEHDKNQGTSAGLIFQRYSAIKKFYLKNRVALAWDFIKEDIGEIPTKTKRQGGGDAYTHDQIEKMVSIADHREKALVSLYYGSGIRRGVAPALIWEDLEPIDEYGIYQITCYRGSKSEYITWCIPEARKAIEEYREFRERYGEKITPESPLFRDKFDISDRLAAKVPNSLGENAIYNILSQLAERAGIRERQTLEDGDKAGKVRHKVKAVHGFRKFFDTQCTNSGVLPLWVEFFEGRQPHGSKGNYYRPANEQLLKGIEETNMRGFVHAISQLTIHRDKLKLEIKEKEYQQAKAELAVVNELKSSHAVMKEYLKEICKNQGIKPPEF